jgi:hypothetical protein
VCSLSEELEVPLAPDGVAAAVQEEEQLQQQQQQVHQVHLQLQRQQPG